MLVGDITYLPIADGINMHMGGLQKRIAPTRHRWT